MPKKIASKAERIERVKKGRDAERKRAKKQAALVRDKIGASTKEEREKRTDKKDRFKGTRTEEIAKRNKKK